MPYRPDVIPAETLDLIYEYDGSFEGMLCCVFESFAKKEMPSDILSPLRTQASLFPPKEIITDPEKAKRVLSSIQPKMGLEALELVKNAYLTCMEQKEMDILRFLRKGYRIGPAVMSMLTDEVVNRLNSAVTHLTREAHLLKGFIRFSIANGVLVAQIEPKNYVLPLLVQHFCERYPHERFMIFDKTHGMGLVYQPFRWAIFPMESLSMPRPDEEEETYRELWRLFYKTIEIPGRHNERCRMSHMPKRYWKNMTEMGGAGGCFSQPSIGLQQGSPGILGDGIHPDS